MDSKAAIHFYVLHTVHYIRISYFSNQTFNAQFYKLWLLTTSHQVTLKDIWKLCFGAKLHSAYAVRLWSAGR